MNWWIHEKLCSIYSKKLIFKGCSQKVSKSQKQFFLKHHCPKSDQNFWRISAQASKMVQMNKNEGTLWYACWYVLFFIWPIVEATWGRNPSKILVPLGATEFQEKNAFEISWPLLQIHIRAKKFVAWVLPR